MPGQLNNRLPPGVTFALLCLLCTSAVAQKKRVSPQIDYRNPLREYKDVRAGGRTIRVEKQLFVEARAGAQQAVTRLNNNIDRALEILPKESHAILERIPWFLMYGPRASNGGRDNGLAYHQRGAPDRHEHLDAAWGGSIVVYSAENYVKITDFWALKAVVHELAHAYQLEQWPEKQPEILQAWQRGMDQGLHHGVLNDKGETLDASYAATNQLEYFAELTCMYFVGCNYHPVNRRELLAYDRRGHDMIQMMWGLQGLQKPARTRFIDAVALASTESDNKPIAPAVRSGSKPNKADNARPLRIWKDTSGNFQVKASLKSYGNGRVTLLKEDGTVITVPVDRLSSEDAKYIESLRR